MELTKDELKIMDALAAGALTGWELETATGFSWEHIRGCLRSLVAKGMISGDDMVQ